MRVVPYSEVLRGVCDLMGFPVTDEGAPNLQGQDWHAAKRAISKALEEAYRAAFFTDTCRTELRQFAPEYDDTETIAAAQFRFFPPTGLYYQSLRETTGNAPAIETEPGIWETDLGYWAEAKREVGADNYDPTENYAEGDQVYDPDTNNVYQMHTDAVAGTDPTDDTKWGIITALNPCVPWTMPGKASMGRIAGVWERDPRKYRGALRVTWEESENGVQIKNPELNQVWIKFQLRAEKLQGGIYSLSASYAPRDDESIVEETVAIVTDSRVFREFSTVADMIAADSTTFRFANCYNFAGTDGVNSTWVKTAEPGLVDNAGDIRQLADGAWVRRTYTDP